MKKIVSILLVALLTLSLAACGSKNTDGQDDKKPNDQNVTETKDPGSVQNALELLTTVWDSHTEDEKFPSAGGDMSEENMATGAPGKFAVTDTEALDATLGFPAASAEKIDDAASLVHMMNANTFTCGAFHVANSDDVADIATALKDHIMQRQWLCGFPDKLVIITAGDYVISVFGASDFVDTFQAKLTAVYPSAKVICDEPIA